MVTTTAYPKDLESLLETLPDLTSNERNLIERAYYRAEEAHEGQTRKSGEPYFTHCVAVAAILADVLKMDAETIAAGLLHDIIEDTPVTREDVRHEFGLNVVRLVDGVTKLTKLPMEQVGLSSDNNRRSSVADKNIEAFRKMLLTMDDDVRVVLVKLADRLHNMRTLGHMPAVKQRKIAAETLEIFAPLANRLGIWQLKWELEDLSFRYLEPDAYRMIATALDERRKSREEYVAHVADRLREELRKYGVENVHITARPKHIYSIYRKMQRKKLPLENIYDIRALRVIVEEDHQCYLVLGIVHNLWHPIPQQFDDYIASPKDNFYRSLHTAVLDGNGKTVEVQIRTFQMHEDAEYGIAAHWRYKEGRRPDKDDAFEARIADLRRMMDMGIDAATEDARDFLSRIQNEVFPDRVYAFTPKGDIIDLPAGSTPVDFAYHIHTEIGHRCRGARVHGKIVSLDYELQMGDQVEIVTAKRGGPSMDWLNDALGYVKTSRAKSKIRHWLRKQNRDKHIVMGRDALDRELKRLGVLDRVTHEAVAALFEVDKLDDFLAAIGAGDITGRQIANRVLEDERRRREVETFEQEMLKPRARRGFNGHSGGGVVIDGTDGLMYNLAKCCSPMPGDAIVGYITRGRGVTIHRTDCTNAVALSEREGERLIDVHWGGAVSGRYYRMPVEIIGQDRPGLLRDVSTLVANEHVNISDVSVNTRGSIATIYMSIEIANNDQLTRILSRMERITSVFEAHRRNSI
jgi:GTP diphosphokinase / guanosine-3',5'-bis(diphosphate) 3'-diphosphatase